MPISSRVTIDGPFDNLVLHHDQVMVGVFVSSGISIASRHRGR
ncbi:MAG: hypothetical protein ABI604_06000 [Nitrospirota bacterium]